MSSAYLLYKSHEPALMSAFKSSIYQPEVEAITYSDMISTGCGLHTSRIKLSFTAKTGPYVRFYMYIPGSLVSELLHLNDDEKSAVTMWLNSVEIDTKP
jgi:hypothetical protein